MRETVSLEEEGDIGSGPGSLYQAAIPKVDKAKDFIEWEATQRSKVKTIFLEWTRSELQNRKDLGSEIERTFEKDVFPLIGNKHIAEVNTGRCESHPRSAADS